MLSSLIYSSCPRFQARVSPVTCIWEMPRIDPRPICMPGMCSTDELQPNLWCKAMHSELLCVTENKHHPKDSSKHLNLHAIEKGKKKKKTQIQFLQLAKQVSQIISYSGSQFFKKTLVPNSSHMVSNCMISGCAQHFTHGQKHSASAKIMVVPHCCEKVSAFDAGYWKAKLQLYNAELWLSGLLPGKK